MISVSNWVLCLFLVPMDVLSIGTTECGENVEIPTGRLPSKILTAGLKLCNGTEIPLLLDINNTDVDLHCSDNGKYCVKFGEDRQSANLTVHSVTFEDEGKYVLYCNHNYITSTTFYIDVTGICEPKLSSSPNNLTCEVDVESPYKPTIVWMDKHRTIYKKKTFTENVKPFQDTFKLTDETREVEMCCTVSYIKEGKEKQDCKIIPSLVGSDEVNDTEKKKIIFIPIICVLGLAVVVALYISRCRRKSFTRKNRERTFSETGLMEDHEAENMDCTLSEPLQRPQDQV